LVGRPLDHGGPVQTVAISPDDGVVATGSEDGTAGLAPALVADGDGSLARACRGGFVVGDRGVGKSRA